MHIEGFDLDREMGGEDWLINDICCFPFSSLGDIIDIVLYKPVNGISIFHSREGSFWNSLLYQGPGQTLLSVAGQDKFDDSAHDELSIV